MAQQNLLQQRGTENVESSMKRITMLNTNRLAVLENLNLQILPRHPNEK